MFNNSLSIPVTEDYPDEFSGKSRSRPRRKRRKSEYRGKNELANRTCKQLTKWWPLLVLAAAVLLLIFEASKLGLKSNTSKSKIGTHEKSPTVAVKKSEGNLNRLDAPRKLVSIILPVFELY